VWRRFDADRVARDIEPASLHTRTLALVLPYLDAGGGQMLFRVVVSASVIVMTVSGCSGGTLDRKQASRLIANLEGFKESAAFSIAIESSFFRESFPLRCRTQAELEHHPVNVLLVKLGWVRYESRSIAVGFHEQADCPVMVLTEAGKSASAAWQAGPGSSGKGTAWTIPIGQRELVDVTGLTDAPGGSKLVEFEWKWAPNRLGTTLDESIAEASVFFRKSRKGSADCQRWDDGWRCRLTHIGNAFDDLGQFSIPY
jgi:hypothetical protein